MLFVTATGEGISVNVRRSSDLINRAIRQLRAGGNTVPEIAEAIGRSVSFVNKRLASMRRRDLEEARESGIVPTFGADPSWTPRDEAWQLGSKRDGPAVPDPGEPTEDPPAGLAGQALEDWRIAWREARRNELIAAQREQLTGAVDVVTHLLNSGVGPSRLPAPACDRCGGHIEPGSARYCPGCTRSGDDRNLAAELIAERCRDAGPKAREIKFAPKGTLAEKLGRTG